jgi:hypothetical protein
MRWVRALHRSEPSHSCTHHCLTAFALGAACGWLPALRSGFTTPSLYYIGYETAAGTGVSRLETGSNVIFGCITPNRTSENKLVPVTIKNLKVSDSVALIGGWPFHDDTALKKFVVKQIDVIHHEVNTTLNSWLRIFNLFVFVTFEMDLKLVSLYHRIIRLVCDAPLINEINIEPKMVPIKFC